MKKITLIVILLAFSGMLRAQDAGSFKLTFDHFALSVKDVDRSAKFYKNVLKLQEITNRTKIPGIRWLSLDEGKELHLISILGGDIKVNKAVHLGLATPKFDYVIKTLDELKITYSDWPGVARTINKREDGVKQIYFQDPDGYWIEVNNVSAPVLVVRLASASDKMDVMKSVNQFVYGFNKGDTTSAAAACADQASIIDEFPPHEWHGIGACLTWMNDYDTDAKKNGITEGIVTLGKPRHLDITAGRAYVVIPSNYTFKRKGKSVRETGSMLTFALQKNETDWRITGWAWAKN